MDPLPKEGEVWAPEKVYIRRLAISARIKLLANHATSAMSFVHPQDEGHRIAWKNILTFIGIYELEQVCLICFHARIWRLFNQSAQEIASEALACLEVGVCTAAIQEKKNVKEETRTAEAKGKATKDDHRIPDDKDQQAKAAIPDVQEVLPVPHPPKKYSAEERQRIPCRYFRKGKGICKFKNCGFGHMA